MTRSGERIPGAEAVPTDLLRAFCAYERALLANDLDALDQAFADSPETLRGDSAGLLVGHAALSAFRGVRGGVPERVIERIEHRSLTEDAALIVSVSRFAAGGTGLQTQLWQREGGRWLITAAHVTPRAQVFDRSVWRIVGDPLLPGAQAGPLAGLTVAVKDLFAVQGHAIGAGNPTFLAHARPETDSAAAVGDLLRAGVSLRGIARTDEFAYSIAGANPHYGTPPNAAVPGALPGGSSNGPAAAVAAGQADIGLATDTAGSIRVPASYQGLWGLRTTHGLVTRRGLLPLAPSFDTVGWLTRDGETLQRVVDTCLGAENSAAEAAEPAVAREPSAGGGRPGSAEMAGPPRLPARLLVVEEALEAAEPATREAFADFLSLVGDVVGAPQISTVRIGALPEYQEAFRTVQAAEAWRCHGEWLRAHPGSVGEAAAERFRVAESVSAPEETAARAVLAGLRDRLHALVRGAVLVHPTVPGTAPARTLAGADMEAVRTATLRMTTPAAVGGLPSLSVPLLTVPSSLGPAPVGVALVGAARTDPGLVRLGRSLVALALEGSAPVDRSHAVDSSRFSS
ncbi:AtzH-like domain-containing protein [Microbacterium sp. gxy059]|uniref:AtzH-like domain-containing protein n=1 Tax=Microbacterium sp. gxy059 TaxID=2957199 RepID=UPI003D974B53